MNHLTHFIWGATLGVWLLVWQTSTAPAPPPPPAPAQYQVVPLAPGLKEIVEAANAPIKPVTKPLPRQAK